MIPEPVIRLRTATEADAAEVAALVHAAYRSDESRSGWTTEADLVGGQRVDAVMVRDLVREEGSVVLLAIGSADGSDESGSDESLLGCCHLERRDDAAYLGMVAVRPGRQGRGIGRRMLDAADEHARTAWGARTLEISVINHRTELIAWYERCGFALTGQEHPFPYGDERYGLPQRADLVLLGMSRPMSARAGR